MIYGRSLIHIICFFCFPVKDCDPSNGSPCSNPEHQDTTADIFSSAEDCCQGMLNWVDLNLCTADSNSEAYSGQHSNQYFADFDSGSCLKDCEPGPFGCASVPPPIAVYETVEACCDMAQNWVDTKYCLSRSNGTYSDGWVVSYDDEKCGKSVAVVCDSHF